MAFLKGPLARALGGGWGPFQDIFLYIINNVIFENSGNAVFDVGGVWQVATSKNILGIDPDEICKTT